jgi:hypothetical protein
MRYGTSLTFWMLAVGLTALAFVLRASVPQNSFLPGGWPWGTRYHHTNQVIFWWFLAQGIVAAFIGAVSTVMEKSLSR